jgi:hypothetical protein
MSLPFVKPVEANFSLYYFSLSPRRPWLTCYQTISRILTLPQAPCIWIRWLACLVTLRGFVDRTTWFEPLVSTGWCLGKQRRALSPSIRAGPTSAPESRMHSHGVTT